MSTVKISELSSSANITSDDFFPIVDSLVTKKATAATMKDFVLGRSGSNDTIHISSSAAIKISANTGVGVVGNTAITGSLTSTEGFTGSLSGTATSASYATTASYALNGGSGAGFPFTGSAEITGSLSVTGSLATNSDRIEFDGAADISGSLSVTGSLSISGSLNAVVTSASYALTASHALNGGGGGITFPYTGSADFEGSLFLTSSDGSGYLLIDTGDIDLNTIGNIDLITKEYGDINLLSNGGGINLNTTDGGYIVVDSNSYLQVSSTNDFIDVNSIGSHLTLKSDAGMYLNNTSATRSTLIVAKNSIRFMVSGSYTGPNYYNYTAPYTFEMFNNGNFKIPGNKLFLDNGVYTTTVTSSIISASAVDVYAYVSPTVSTTMKVLYHVLIEGLDEMQSGEMAFSRTPGIGVPTPCRIVSQSIFNMVSSGSSNYITFSADVLETPEFDDEFRQIRVKVTNNLPLSCSMKLVVNEMF